ncbi:hypothetical protein GWI33_016403 [Rhynchophorus ferrugineus]|uniref:Uncharacterized protein n=1 Tax=Rhynchophorus ferrugineus TaxID=354439 RepID=A0A834I1Q1_RHYFE|nr:hypothetical protein GWI33_016403 [Rhynchophorus ferrugineus]
MVCNDRWQDDGKNSGCNFYGVADVRSKAAMAIPRIPPVRKSEKSARLFYLFRAVNRFARLALVDGFQPHENIPDNSSHTSLLRYVLFSEDIHPYNVFYSDWKDEFIKSTTSGDIPA